MSKTERKCHIYLENFVWSSDVSIFLEMRVETFQERINENRRNVTPPPKKKYKKTKLKQQQKNYSIDYFRPEVVEPFSF